MKIQYYMLCLLMIGIILICCSTLFAEPIGTAFTYQGRLLENGQPATGTYDLQCRLFDSKTGGNQVGQTLVFEDGSSTDGYFTVQIDFGIEVFNGEARYLEIAVRPWDSTLPENFVVLDDRVELTCTPYSLQTRGIYVDNDLKVGFGTTNPTGKLHVATESACGDILFFDAGSGQNDLSTHPNASYTDTVPRVYIVQVTSASGSPDLFRWSDDNGATWSSDQLQMTTDWYTLSHGVQIKWMDVNGHVSGDAWAWIAYPSEVNVLVVKNGMVGIGTATPGWKLQVVNSRAGESVEAGVSANDAGGALAAYSSTYSAYPHFADRVSLFSGALTATGLDLRADGTNSDIRFYTGGIEAANERMRINENGQVTIGSTYQPQTNSIFSVGGVHPNQECSIYGTGRNIAVCGDGTITGVYGHGEQRGVVAYAYDADNLNETVGLYGYASSGSVENTIAVKGVVYRRSSQGTYYSGYFEDADNEGTYLGLYADYRTGDAIDLAEYIYDTHADTEPGDVLVADPSHDESVVKSFKPYDSTVVGIVSTQPHLLMGMEVIKDEETGRLYENVDAAMLALAGRVPVKVTDENGPIKRGDLLTTSSKAGYAMKWTLLDVNEAEDFEQLKSMLAENERRRNAIVGKSLGTLDSGDGSMMILVNLQ